MALICTTAIAAGIGCGSEDERSPGPSDSGAAPETTTSSGEQNAPAELKPGPWPVGESEFRTIAVEPGDAVPLHDSPGGRVIDHADAQTEFGSQRVFWVSERSGRRGRWLGVPSPVQLSDELVWVRLERDRMRFGETEYMIRVTLAERRLELLRRGKVIHGATVDVGAAQTPTPTGQFAVTDVLDNTFADVYGCCVVALSSRQPDLPAGWTGGDRIAIHGKPGGGAGAAASNGCVRSVDADMAILMEHVTPGVPVFVEQSA